MVMGYINVTKGHVVGFAAGVGVCVAGYYLYKSNQKKVDSFLRSQGINIPVKNNDIKEMSLEELMLKKEELEDIIAEKELNTKNQSVAISGEEEIVTA